MLFSMGLVISSHVSNEVNKMINFINFEVFNSGNHSWKELGLAYCEGLPRDKFINLVYIIS